ncbi:3,4-dihydroxy-2-butanone-4-phosphate synthase [Sphingomonas sp. TDK1]|uniref:3,4-dihydroxy-2-butanone-4-phosphate synthase n=1 Tax=Sphingomonas sp. TDK1 TaxID=453247 RepID=UPI000A7104D0|nr:3,4-dihydroxy-2-butanone-4-phosphate synthase [Sphingomonas sp. TDK1]
MSESEVHAAKSSAEAIINEARNGRMFILMDDEDRENEGDLVIPAQMATPDAINFMATHGRGLICLALSRERVSQLQLPMMTKENKSPHETAFTVSIEAREGVTTGISAADRARTIAVAINAAGGPETLVTPGHVFPLVARDGGVLVRAGHTEAAVDVARLAGLNPSGVICEIMKEDGTMARGPDLVAFAREHNLKIGTIRDLIAHRMRFDRLIERVAQSEFVSEFGDRWTMAVYESKIDGTRAYVMQKGAVLSEGATLVRVHVASAFYDLLGVPGPRQGLIPKAIRRITEHGAGVILVLLPPAKTHVSAGPDVNPMDRRSYGLGAQVLADLGIHDMILLRNPSGRSIGSLGGYGLNIVGEMLFSPPEQ